MEEFRHNPISEIGSTKLVETKDYDVNFEDYGTQDQMF